MVVKNGKAWGSITVAGGSPVFTRYGWVDLADAPIHPADHVRHPMDVVPSALHAKYASEMEGATVAPVERVTTTRIRGADQPANWMDAKTGFPDLRENLHKDTPCPTEAIHCPWIHCERCQCHIDEDNELSDLDFHVCQRCAEYLRTAGDSA